MVTPPGGAREVLHGSLGGAAGSRYRYRPCVDRADMPMSSREQGSDCRMKPHRDLTFTPAVELARLYRKRTVSPLEVMQALLARIDAVNPRVNAVVTLARESALREARAATTRLKRGATL